MMDWKEVAARPLTWHASIPDGFIALSHEADGWYWGAFSYQTGMRISDGPKPYQTREDAERDAERWLTDGQE